MVLELEAVRRQVNALYTESLARALALAQARVSDLEATSFVREVALRSRPLARRVERAERQKLPGEGALRRYQRLRRPSKN